MNGIERIAKERARQISEEGWTPEHDDRRLAGSLVKAAACYTVEGTDARVLVVRDGYADGSIHFDDAWPWDGKWDKRKKHDKLRRLEIAGALIAAEIDRLLREKEKTK